MKGTFIFLNKVTIKIRRVKNSSTATRQTAAKKLDRTWQNIYIYSI